MKTISVRDLRQRWPEAEARLQVEKEIVITRDAAEDCRREDVALGRSRAPQSPRGVIYLDPFHFQPLATGLFQTALRQDREARRFHCRTLDRFHLAAMEELGLRRLMTTDAAQAVAAKALDLEVLTPGQR